MDCDFKVNQIPNGIQVEYNKTNEDTDSKKQIKHHFEHVNNDVVSIRMPDNRYVKYNIETCDIVTKVNHFETVAEYYYTNDTIGCSFKIKSRMCSPRIDPTTHTILFHNMCSTDYYIYILKMVLLSIGSMQLILISDLILTQFVNLNIMAHIV
jgi:hypothetical protein